MTATPRPVPEPTHTDQEQLRLAVPALPQSVSAVRRAVTEFAEHAGLDQDAVADVALAVSEACANAVVHAYRPGHESATLEVFVECSEDRLTLAVCDDGIGMAPRTDSPGLGLGLPLMASLSSTLELRQPPGGGTEVWMTFALRPADAQRFSRTG